MLLRICLTVSPSWFSSQHPGFHLIFLFLYIAPDSPGVTIHCMSLSDVVYIAPDSPSVTVHCMSLSDVVYVAPDSPGVTVHCMSLSDVVC